MTPPETRAYRDRIYERYVSVYKGACSPERRADAFDRHAKFLDHLIGPVVASARPRDVLEIGCGAGAFLHWARTRGLSVRGFDRSPEQVAVARAMGLPAEVADYRDYLRRHADACDLVVALDVVEHLVRDEVFEMLELAHFALRPGGTLFLTTPNGAGLRPGPVVHGDLTHETIFSPSTIALVLCMTGYVAVEVSEISPPPTSVRSTVRGLLWRVIRLGPMLVDLIETGSRSTPIYSRVMAVRGRRER